MFFFFSSRRRHTRLQGDWSSDVCSSDLKSCSCRSTHQPAVQFVTLCHRQLWLARASIRRSVLEQPLQPGPFEARRTGSSVALVISGGYAAEFSGPELFRLVGRGLRAAGGTAALPRTGPLASVEWSALSVVTHSSRVAGRSGLGRGPGRRIIPAPREPSAR